MSIKANTGFAVVTSKRKTPERDLLPRSTWLTRCVAVMGNLTPAQGHCYWKVEVDECLDCTVGVAFEDIPKQEDLGANCLS